MRVKLDNLIQSLIGGIKDSQIIFSERNGRIIGSSRPKRKKRKKMGQSAWVVQNAAAKRAWKTLTLEQVNAWNEFGKTFGRYSDDRRGPRRGYDIFVKTNGYRIMMELPIVQDGPTEAAPAPVASIEVLPVEQPDTFSFRVTHGLRYPADHVVFVRISPAMLHNALTPQRTALRKIRGLGPASCAPLPESGGIITFTECAQSIDAGRRFIIEMRVVRITDGLVSDPVMVDTLR